MSTLVIASGNAGKLREIGRILAPFGIEAVPQSAFNVPDCPEPHVTFVENCLAKARHASRVSGLPALADDSGLCVDALGGAPGVQSARYAGEPKSDVRNNAKLIADLKDVPERRAHYTCVMVYVRHPDDPEPVIAEGHWHGEIIDTPRGDHGFGYDPYFLVPQFGQTGAELDEDSKNSVSHRGQALRDLVSKLKALGRIG
ncbi:MAG: non-canonical purine NTP pyrophosphatase, RdgB/HAM1 family [Hydrogenophilales bacterium 16-64-46]|nr:MAG: non-canonical purine NTP pyrophosphatase, RdgB/HAM1 family [Hydrogenophilales bacterium 12-64-13]OYZ04395.1 MAG: non-canonical purine NTP pyrophosphatase, RdgB/HAM1 family [Hydrogenophilales bacterium 16-64-46]OZA38241.1 MAG: non-canonical purine NTP pyrophosphatase, RdgB/HAM1 family [Hydrogenophilales bacterium 17-64-34]HQS99145.1 RdgB/HAM1 family non-canonical purine NTP pyrophosphatase [Thiobacillus sp.]